MIETVPTALVALTGFSYILLGAITLASLLLR